MKKRKKLILQIGVVFALLIAFMIIILTQTIYQGTVNGFLKAKDSQISGRLEVSFYNLLQCSKDSFYYDFWEKHPEIKDLPESALTEEEEQEAVAYYVENGSWDEAWLKDKSEDIQLDCAAKVYGMVKAELDGTSLDYQADEDDASASSEDPEQGAEEEPLKTEYEVYLEDMVNYYMTGRTKEDDFDRTFVIDINEPNEGFVYFDFNNKEGGDERELGSVIDMDLSDHPALREILSEQKNEVCFERTRDYPAEGRYYVGYKPIMVKGKVRAVLGIAYEWSGFRAKILKIFAGNFLFSLVCLLVSVILLLLILYRRVLVPVEKIHAGVAEYADTKNIELLTRKMKSIRQNNELGALSLSIGEMAQEIDRYTAENIRLAKANARVSSELDMARNIQDSQLPDIFPPFPDRKEFSIYASMKPAMEVGGDFYDFFFVDDDHLALVMADVSGKGVPAALFMMMSKILIANYALKGLDPGSVLTLTNETVCRNNRLDMFVTVWLGILEISTGKVTASNAGHEFPVIRQPGGSYELFKDKHGFVVGGMEGVRYRTYEFTLQKGGTLFVYTDGVPEATNASGELFGTGRLLQALNGMPEAGPEELLSGVTRSVETFVGEAPQFDDLTMLAITLNNGETD